MVGKPAWSWSDVAAAPVEPAPAPSAPPALVPLTLEQRQRFAEIEREMVRERREIWEPLIQERDVRLEVLRAEIGVPGAQDRFRRRLRQP